MTNRPYASESIIQTLAGLSRTKEGRWCYPSQVALLKLLVKFHGVGMSRRSLNRYLRELVARGYIRRVRRISRGRDGKPRFASTVYVICRKMYQAAARMAGCLGLAVGRAVRKGLGVSESEAGGADRYLEGPEVRLLTRKFLEGFA